MSGERQILICMRLANMHVVHPKQVERVCARCGETVGVYPSGQDVIRKMGTEAVELVCDTCYTNLTGKLVFLAPGAIEERDESVPAKGKS